MVALPAIPLSCFNSRNLVWLAAWHTITTTSQPFKSKQHHDLPPNTVQTKTHNKNWIQIPRKKTGFNVLNGIEKGQGNLADHEDITGDYNKQIGSHGRFVYDKSVEIKEVFGLVEMNYRITRQYKFKEMTFRNTSTKRLYHRMLFYL